MPLILMPVVAHDQKVILYLISIILTEGIELVLLIMPSTSCSGDTSAIGITFVDATTPCLHTSRHCLETLMIALEMVLKERK